MSAWKGKRITIAGLGLHGGGVSAAEFFVHAGAEVLVTDLRGKEDLAPSLERLAGLDITYVLGEHREKDFENRDLILRNPGVPPDSPYIQHAQEQNIPVFTDAGLFMRDTDAFVIGVTGTKGKSTCTALIAEGLSAVLHREIPPVAIPGGTAFLSALEQRLPIVVAEFSSWDLESVHDAERSPQIAVVTNFFPDHLNRHKTMGAYAKAKGGLVKYQEPDDIAIYRASNPAVGPIIRDGNGKRVAIADHAADELPPLTMAGKHQRLNATLAYTAIEQALLHPDFPKKDPSYALKDARDAIAAFPGLPGRYELLGTRDGHALINDTCATNPGAAATAIEATEQPIVLIAGGDGKGLEYQNLANAIAKKVQHVVLLPGSGSDDLLGHLKTIGYEAVSTGIMDMKEAVAEAFRKAASGATILLSPGASSLNAFRNEFDRGDQFREAVEVGLMT